MKVHACFLKRLDVTGNDTKLVDLWKRSWAKHGWDPVVLDGEGARKHPYYSVITNSDWLKLCPNDWEYTKANYGKFMLMAMNGGGLYSDFDIINYGWTPADFAAIPDKGRGLAMSDSQVSLLWAEPGFWEQCVRCFRNAALMRAWGPFCVGDSISDMNLFADFMGRWIRHLLLANAFLNPGWESNKLVHFHGGVMPTCNDRSSAIQKIRPI